MTPASLALPAGPPAALAEPPAPAAAFPPAVTAVPAVTAAPAAPQLAPIARPARVPGRAARNLRAAAPAVATALAALALWEALCRWLAVPEVLLPAPSGIARALLSHAGPLALHGWATTLETLAAFAVATALGIALAAALTLSTLLKEMVYPYIVALQTVPKVALAPLFTVWLSIGFSSRLAIAVFVSIFSILVPLLAGLRSTPTDALRMAHCAGASRWQAFVHVRFPYALPYLFSGLKIAATTVVIGVVVGEFITSDKGLGHLILYSASRLETAVLMAAIVLLCVLGLALYSAVAWLDAATRRWMGVTP